MRLILLGPPGSGKGTQANLLSERFALEHIGTGDILRQAIRDKTEAGLRARPFIEQGQLVPDDLANEIVAECFAHEDRPRAFVLDGYPRTVGQAQKLDQVLAAELLPLDAVLLIQVNDEEIVRRVAQRWNCPRPGCKRTYHLATRPEGQTGVCDRCGTPLVQRDDDRPETVRERLGVYRRTTAALIPYYRNQGLLREICGQGAIEEVHRRIEQTLGPLIRRGE